MRVALRVLGIFMLLASFPLAYGITRRAGRSYAQGLLRCFGIRLRVVDNRGAVTPEGGVLVVAGHVGWTDVLALRSVAAMSFVARADLVDWPVLGRPARMAGVIPIRRERLRELPAVVAQIADRLSSGENVTVFPEATTWCGRAYGRLRPALFQAAVDARVPVQPIRLRYLDAAGKVSTAPGFVGVETMFASVSRLLRSTRVTVEVELLPLQQGSDRRELAQRCGRLIRDAAFLSASGSATGVQETALLSLGSYLRE